MTVRQDPPRPLPAGHRYFHEVVAEIMEAEDLVQTGFHFSSEPSPAEIRRIAEVHEHCDAADLVARRIETGATRPSWTLLSKADSAFERRAEIMGWQWSAAHDGFINEHHREDREGWSAYTVAPDARAAIHIGGGR